MEITPILPVARQFSPNISKNIWNFCGIIKCLCWYSSISRRSLKDIVRFPWKSVWKYWYNFDGNTILVHIPSNSRVIRIPFCWDTQQRKIPWTPQPQLHHRENLKTLVQSDEKKARWVSQYTWWVFWKERGTNLHQDKINR